MKITDVDVHVVSPMGNVEVVEGSRWGYVFVEVHTDEGITGLGECSNWPRNADVLIGRAIQTIKAELIGRDPEHIERIWLDLFRHYTYLGNRGLITTVISGIDIALWDIKGKILGRPIYDLLGGPVRDSVVLYSHPGGSTPEEAAANSRQLVDQGLTALKLDPFLEMSPHHTAYVGGYISKPGVAEAARIIAAVRDEVGPDIELLIDFHGNYNVSSAMQCIRALEPYDITWFEEPFPPEGLSALRQLRSQTNVNLCVGERLFTRWDFQPVLAEGLTNFIMPDVCWTGGISELKKISTMAEAHFVSVSPHNALGPIQIAAGSQVMMTVPNFYRLEMNTKFTDMYNMAITPGLAIHDGIIIPSRLPGHGFELNHEYVERHVNPLWSI